MMKQMAGGGSGAEGGAGGLGSFMGKYLWKTSPSDDCVYLHIFSAISLSVTTLKFMIFCLFS